MILCYNIIRIIKIANEVLCMIKYTDDVAFFLELLDSFYNSKIIHVDSVGTNYHVYTDKFDLFDFEMSEEGNQLSYSIGLDNTPKAFQINTVDFMVIALTEIRKQVGKMAAIADKKDQVILYQISKELSTSISKSRRQI